MKLASILIITLLAASIFCVSIPAFSQPERNWYDYANDYDSYINNYYQYLQGMDQYVNLWYLYADGWDQYVCLWEKYAKNWDEYTDDWASTWKKVSGNSRRYSGVPDGICKDRENSYAWSMECMDGYLYVGTSRDVLAPMLMALGIPFENWPKEFPYPTDMRGRIYRMNIATGKWNECYVCDPVYVPQQPILGDDLGYRMMKTYTASGAAPVLYVGGTGLSACRLLAVEKSGCVTPVFTTSVNASDKLTSIRAIATYAGELFWATEDSEGMGIWHSSNPLKQCKAGIDLSKNKITIPSSWFPKGAEIWDMVSFNGYLYVFFANHDSDNTGFWCAKLCKRSTGWKWQVIVGDTPEAKYEPGLGRPENGAGVPCVFKDKVYVGTMDGTVIRVTSDMSGGGMPDPSVMTKPNGQQIFRFDKYDKWERIMPPKVVSNPDIEYYLNGFLNPLNVYIWRLGVQDGKLYAGTFDVRTMLESIAPLLGFDVPTLINPAGFDLYCTTDGEIWYPVSINGFGDRWNYGVRSFCSDPDTDDLYLGTANPYYGCQIWKKKAPL